MLFDGYKLILSTPSFFILEEKIMKENDKTKKTECTPFKFEGKEVPVIVYENPTDKWVEFSEIFEGIDLKMNFNNLLGSFIRKSDHADIITFEFKYNKQLLKITKDDLKAIKEFLGEEGGAVPEQFANKLKQYFRNNEKFVTEKKKLDAKESLFKLFYNPGVPVRVKRQKLGHYLKEHGLILRRGVNNPYLLDKNSNGYNSVDTDDLVEKLDEEIFKHLDLVHSEDVEKALGFIADRRRPVYNIVKFPNCLYDMENFRVIKSIDEPIFTLIEVKYNYNPKAKGNKIIEFLNSSLKQNNDDEKQTEERVIGFLEMIGYILTSGNKLAAFFILSGIGGAGKGVATNLIVSIFGSDKVGGLQLHELTPDNKFATAHLENKQVNIVRDSPKTPIEDTGMLKSITGYDDIPIEHKGKDKYMIPKEEVPDMILVCNNVPKFKEGIEEEIVQRVVIFEFLNRFRGTDNDNTNLLKEILEDEEEMEWLIFNGIKAYKKMIQKGNDFKARVDEKKTRKLLGKHSDPITFVLPDFVKATKDDITDEDPIIAKELNALIRYQVKKKGMSITDLDNHGRIKARVLVEKIRKCFELDNNWTTKSEYIPDLEKSVTVYPNLYKTAEYDDILKEMKKEGEEQEENK